jgi:hypothetical protein
MGVHDVGKYSYIHSLLGIPANEPIFILRAQDRLSVATIVEYRRFYTQRMLLDHQVPEEQFVANLDEVISDFIDWQQRNPGFVKLPD